MRLPLLAIVVLAGCAAGPAEDPAALRAAQEAACAAVVAPHEGVAVDAVTAEREGVTPEGLAVVTVRSPGAVHSCEVDDGLRVHRVLHPGH